MKQPNLRASLWTPVCSRYLAFTFLLFFSAAAVKAQCYATLPHNGTNAVNDATIGTVDFSNVENSLGSDNATASASSLITLFNGTTHYLKVTGFNFNIPSYASICGVVVDVEKRAGGLAIGAWIRDNEVRIVKNNVVTGSNGGDGATDWVGAESVFNYGGGTQMWGTTLTPADVNSPNFGVAISVRLRGLLVVFPSAHIDNIRVTVYYNLILPVKLLSFTAALKNNVAKLNWETSGEEDGEYITLQRSPAGGSQWTDIARYTMQYSEISKNYNYSDRLTKTGNYTYRLMITNRDKQNTFSEIRSLAYTGTNLLLIYPNPAREVLTLENVQDPATVRVTNLSQQRLNLNVQLAHEQAVKVDVSRLPRGLYFITADGHTLKFFKE